MKPVGSNRASIRWESLISIAGLSVSRPIELVLGDGFVAAPVGGRLYLSQSWLGDPQRCAKAGVPPDVGFATKNEIALSLIEEALADQVVPAPVLADAAYGNSFGFRAHLRELKLEFFVQVTPEEHKGWSRKCPRPS